MLEGQAPEFPTFNGQDYVHLLIEDQSTRPVGGILKTTYYCSSASRLQFQHFLSRLMLITSKLQPKNQKNAYFGHFDVVFSHLVEALRISM